MQIIKFINKLCITVFKFISKAPSIVVFCVIILPNPPFKGGRGGSALIFGKTRFGDRGLPKSRTHTHRGITFGEVLESLHLLILRFARWPHPLMGVAWSSF